MRKQTLSTFLCTEPVSSVLWFDSVNPGVASKSHVQNIYHGVSSAIMSVIMFIFLSFKGIFSLHKSARLRTLKPTILEQKLQTFDVIF